MPGSAASASNVPRQLAAMIARDDAGGAMQVARAAVIAESRPEMQHSIERRGGERARHPGTPAMKRS